jgi:hypothetical protein
MTSNVYHGGKPEARHQVVEAIDEATVGIRNELGEALAACMQSNGGHLERVL